MTRAAAAATDLAGTEPDRSAPGANRNPETPATDVYGSTPIPVEQHEARAGACFYWAVLEPPPRSGPRITTESLRYAFEPFVPAPIDTIECRFVRPDVSGVAGEGLRPIIACGVDRASLQNTPVGETTIGPGAIPGFVIDRLGAIDERALLAAFTFPCKAPNAGRLITRARLAAAALVLAAGLICAGLLRRAEAHRDAAQASRSALAALVAETLGPARGAEASLPPAVRLQAESRRLARTRTSDDSGGPRDASMPARPPDIAGDYIALLAAWPAEFPTRVEQIDLRADTLTIRGGVRDAADFERLKLALAGALCQNTDAGAQRFDPPSGSTTRAREGFSFDLALRRHSPTKDSTP